MPGMLPIFARSCASFLNLSLFTRYSLSALLSLTVRVTAAEDLLSLYMLLLIKNSFIACGISRFLSYAIYVIPNPPAPSFFPTM